MMRPATCCERQDKLVVSAVRKISTEDSLFMAFLHLHTYCNGSVKRLHMLGSDAVCTVAETRRLLLCRHYRNNTLQKIARFKSNGVAFYSATSTRTIVQKHRPYRLVYIACSARTAVWRVRSDRTEGCCCLREPAYLPKDPNTFCAIPLAAPAGSLRMAFSCSAIIR